MYLKFMTKGKKVEEIQVVAKKLIKIEGTPVYKQPTVTDMVMAITPVAVSSSRINAWYLKLD